MKKLFSMPLGLLFSFLLPLTGAAEKPAVVYRWDAAGWLTKYSQTQFSAAPITNTDGSIGARVTVTPRDAGNPYNHIIVTSAGMKGGNQYTAAITFSVVEPTKYPTSFYMFARNSAGLQYDIWQTWIGLPGATRTVTLPLDLKPVTSGTWKLFMGISKSGGLNINSIVVYSGLTSDGTTSYTTAGGASTPPPALPAGVTEATGYTPFTIVPPAASKVTVSLADYKLTADAPGAPASVAADNAKALQTAFNDCKGKGPMTLVIPKGTYRLAPVSNFVIDGLNDVTIDGQGSVLVFENFTKEGPAFLVGRCARTLLENFTVDWDWNVKPIASLGTVSNLSADKLQCDFTFPDLDAPRTKITQATPWRSIFAMDSTHLYRTPDPSEFRVPREAVITAGTAGNILHVVFPKPVPFSNGQAYCIRHLYYEMCGFKVFDSSDLAFNAVDIYSIPGMGWFVEASMHNFQFSNCKIHRAPGSRNPLTTAADGLHVDQFIDNLNVENCDFTGSGDDAMNIHTESYQGTIVTDGTDATKLTLMNCPSYLLRLSPGDPVEFYNGDYSNLGDSATPVTSRVASVSSTYIKGAPQTIVHFTTKLPPGITAASILSNGRFKTSNVRIAGCNVEYSNGRGILLSAQNALISDCHLRNVYGTGINLESDLMQGLWSEGRGDSNVLIKNNTFEDDNMSGRYNGAVIYTNTRMPWGQTKATLYKQISIENNRFLNCPGPAVTLSNGSNILIRSNEISATHSIPNLTQNAGAILITNSSDLALGGNQWKTETSDPLTARIVYDPATTFNLSPGPAATDAKIH